MNIRENLIAYIVLGALITTAMAAVVRYAPSSRDDAISAQTEAVINQLAQIQARVEELENMLARLKVNAPRPASELYAQVDPDLKTRLERLEQQLAAMGEPDVDLGSASEPSDQQTLADALQDRILGSKSLPSRPPLAEIFSQDKGSSQWGVANIARVSDAYAQEPWFHPYGGELTTQCRQTSCKVEWVVPTVEPDDHTFALAEYELMAAATRNTNQIGRVQTKRRIEAGRTIISVYLQRR